MQTVFFIGDTHFGHKRICEFEPIHRPFLSIEEHDEELVRRWNNTVKKNDIVWHLGDFAFAETLPIANRLNGKKRLVLGNHDMRPAAEYMLYFERLVGMAAYKDYLLSHMPAHPSCFDRWRANIHGHLHSKKLDDRRYINVSAEQIDLTPIAFEEIKIKHGA